MELELIKPAEVDRLLRYPDGRSAHLAASGVLPSIKLPDGEVRFDLREIHSIIEAGRQPTKPAEVPHAG